MASDGYLEYTEAIRVDFHLPTSTRPMPLSDSLARILGAPPSVTPVTPTNVPTDPVAAIGTLYDSVFHIITLIAGILAVIYVIYAGVQYLMAAGNADKAKAARASLVNAVIGIIIIVSAYTIISLAIAVANGLSNTVAGKGSVENGTAPVSGASTGIGTGSGPAPAPGPALGATGTLCNAPTQCASNLCNLNICQ